jgi:rhodanese-related sulfurtransferase
MTTSTHFPNQVTLVPAARPATSATHFESRLAFETDPSDVAAALADEGNAGFVLLDARSPDAYAAGHLPGAVNLQRPFVPADVEALPFGLIVVYCWGPGCNGAAKAAAQLARLGRPVKEMLGGFEYWVREGHLVEGEDSRLHEAADQQGLVKLRGAISCLC